MSAANDYNMAFPTPGDEGRASMPTGNLFFFADGGGGSGDPLSECGE